MTTPTKPRKRREVELPAYLSACRRMLRAAGKRAGDADPEDLATLLELRAELEGVIAEAVTGMRTGARQASWAEVARGLGTTRQAAQMRYGKQASA